MNIVSCYNLLFHCMKLKKMYLLKKDSEIND